MKFHFGSSYQTQKCHSPFQHTDVLVRDETLNPSHLSSPPITRGLAVKDERLALLEGKLSWGSRYIVEHSHRLPFCTRQQTQSKVTIRSAAHYYHEVILVVVRSRDRLGSCVH